MLIYLVNINHIDVLLNLMYSLFVLLHTPHNLKVVGSNPAPATKPKTLKYFNKYKT